MIHTYWTGPERPLNTLCLETIAKNCPGSRRWTKAEFEAEYDGSLGPWEKIARLHPAGQADVLRAWLLKTRGGIWVDADCIVFRDLSPLYDQVDKVCDIMAYRFDSGQVLNGLMASRPCGTVISGYCRRIQQRLASSQPIDFYSLGPNLLAQSMLANSSAIRYFVPKKDVQLLRWRVAADRELMLSGREVTWPESSWCFMLVHAIVDYFANSSREELLESPNAIGQALRRALCQRSS